MDGISKSQVSRLCEDIDTRVNAFLHRPLEGDWPYIGIDATYVKTRQNGFRYGLTYSSVLLSGYSGGPADI